MRRPDPGPGDGRTASGENGGNATDTPGSYRLVHVADRREWDAATRSGVYLGSTRGRTLAQQGFVHASTAGQLPGVLHRFYADVLPADLVVLVVDVHLLTAAGVEVRWEPPPGAIELFPHFYGGLPGTAVVAVLPPTADSSGLAAPELAGYRVMLDPPSQ